MVSTYLPQFLHTPTVPTYLPQLLSTSHNSYLPLIVPRYFLQVHILLIYLLHVPFTSQINLHCPSHLSPVRPMCGPNSPHKVLYGLYMHILYPGTCLLPGIPFSCTSLGMIKTLLHFAMQKWNLFAMQKWNLGD